MPRRLALLLVLSLSTACRESRSPMVRVRTVVTSEPTATARVSVTATIEGGAVATLLRAHALFTRLEAALTTPPDA